MQATRKKKEVDLEETEAEEEIIEVDEADEADEVVVAVETEAKADEVAVGDKISIN